MNEYWDIFIQNDELLRSSLERVEIKYLVCLQVELGIHSREFMVEKYNLPGLATLDEWIANLLPYDCPNTYSNGEMSCIDDIGMQKVMEEIRNNNAARAERTDNPTAAERTDNPTDNPTAAERADSLANVMATQVKYTNDRNTLKLLLSTLYR